MSLVLPDQALEEIERIGRLRAPAEAVGILLPSPHRGRWVWEMPNRSTTPHNGSMLVLEDVRLELEDWIREADEDQVMQMVIWHTHPGGNIGPSKEDLDNAPEGLNLLVVALREHEAVPTWYFARS